MITELIRKVKDHFSQDVLSKASVRLDETALNITRTMESLVPAVLAALLKKNSTSGQTGLDNMVTVSRNILGDPARPLSENLKKIFSNAADPNGIHLMQQADGILENMFGDRLQPLAETVSRFSGVKSSSAHQLLAVAAPAVLSVIGQHMERQDMDERELMQQLTMGKQDLIEQVPAGLELAAALGIEKLDDLDARPSIPDHDLAAAEKIAPGKSGRWLVLFIIIVILVAAIWFWKNYNKKQDSYRLRATSAVPGHYTALG